MEAGEQPRRWARASRMRFRSSGSAISRIRIMQVHSSHEAKADIMNHLMNLEPLEKRTLLSTPGQVWQIRGDVDPNNLNDVIVVQPSSSDASVLEATVNGNVVD